MIIECRKGKREPINSSALDKYGGNKMIFLKTVSSNEKVFLDGKANDYTALSRISALKGERISFQIISYYEKSDGETDPFLYPIRLKPETGGMLAPFVNLREVVSVPVARPVGGNGDDGSYIRTTPGLFPDILKPLPYDGSITFCPNLLLSTWVTAEIPEDIEAGEYTFTISARGGKWGTPEVSFTVEVIDAALPKDEIYFTQWFHCDGLSEFYHVPVWSEEHWRIVENFARTARKNGINLLLTPVFTPPLDTAVGGERKTTQLVDVTVSGGAYSFGFDRLDRWIDMCHRVGIENLEISHLFTQWGAAHAPKIMATVDGEYKKIFGWETDALSDEYRTFLREFLTALVSHLKRRGVYENCVFHVSDEPSLDHLEAYRSAKKVITDVIGDAYIMDALSKIDFYKTGALDHPVVASNHIEDFLEAKVDKLWTYYCVSQWKDVSNRFHGMSAARNRSIGYQLFKFDIAGFLQWGYNFYNNQNSVDPINPYMDCTSGYAFPGGDPFSVYPAPNGEAYESARLVVFAEALTDLKAMKLLSALIGKNETVKALEEALGFEIRFDKCLNDATAITALRERVNALIKENIAKK